MRERVCTMVAMLLWGMAQAVSSTCTQILKSKGFRFGPQFWDQNPLDPRFFPRYCWTTLEVSQGESSCVKV